MRQVALLLIIACILPLLGSDLPREYDGATENGSIEGTWQWVSETKNGVPLFPPAHTVTYRRSTIVTFQSNDEADIVDYDVDVTRKPFHFNRIRRVTNGEVQVWRCIFKIECNTLTIAFPLRLNKGRPRSFDEKDIHVAVYKRVK